MSHAFEVNFDGLVGPTHSYAGLSYGNIASTNNRALSSNPREAALQGLRKMNYLCDLGLKQAVLAPQDRPDVETLRRLGFSGTDADVLKHAAEEAPEILAACCSSSSMWTANAATIAPSSDTADGKVHFTAANLTSKFHRSIEPATTSRMLRTIFPDPAHFVHHEPLPAGIYLGDEGAANHTRFCQSYGKKGLQFFVYGRYGFRPGEIEPKRFPARQTFEASSAIARLHQLDSKNVVFAQQNPDVIDAGVFHHDVAGVGNEHVLLCHEQAFLNRAQVHRELQEKFFRLAGKPLIIEEVSRDVISVPDAVNSYLFNSQLISLPSGEMALIAPLECQQIPGVKAYLDSLIQKTALPIRNVHYFDLRQSMQNGGGPACLRLRVVLTPDEILRSNPSVFMSPELFETLSAWVIKRYRDRLEPKDLADPQLLQECRTALDELTQILNLGSIYPFQR